MADYREAFVGIDVAKLRNAIAIADAGREGEVRFFGEVDACVASMRRTIQRIADRFDRLHFCYEAGPTGYGLYRLIRSLGHECTVVAPSLIPRKPGDRVKTNRRDALSLARLLRAGELTAVWVPDAGHEAMRDLVRARSAAVEVLRVHRQQVSAFMLKHGRVYPRKKGWTMRYLRWLQEQTFDHPAHQIALQEMVEAVRISKERVERLERTIEEFVPAWSLAPVVRALRTLRGVDLIVAVTFVTEVGDVSRFESPRQLMGYLGLVPGERSTGDTIRRGGITKALVHREASYAEQPRHHHEIIVGRWRRRHRSPCDPGVHLEQIERVALRRRPPGLGGVPASAKVESATTAFQRVERARRICRDRQHGACLRRIDRDAGIARFDHQPRELADGFAERALGTSRKTRAGLALQVDAAGVVLF